MKTLKQLREERASFYKELSALNSEAESRQLTDEEQTKWEDLTKQHTVCQRSIEQAESFEKIQKDNAEQKVEDRSKKEPEAEYRSAFDAFIRKGTNGISAEERSLLEQRAVLAGQPRTNIVPTLMATEIEKALKDSSTMMEVGSIFSTTSGVTINYPTLDNLADKGEIKAEYDSVKKGKKAFSTIAIKAFTYASEIIPISEELLADANFDIQAVISEATSDDISAKINDDLTNGDGDEKPKGIVASAFECENKAKAKQISLDDLIKLQTALKGKRFQKNARYMFNSKTLEALRLLKDTTGRYIISEGANGAPTTLFGKPFVINDDMDDIAAGKVSVLYGDFSKYKIRMVKGITVKRLNEVYAENLAIGIFSYVRLDGVLIDAGNHPVIKLVHANA